ncbi:hypothetical protein C8J57DRAFT_1348451 [Mycena rebaudengoi]|nr:hypothetical protein C8J57DRAFT_1348451 [Mycena rebaudengoi]
MSTPTQAQASQNALLPPIPELFGPDFLNKLVTRGDSAPVVQGSPAGPSSAPVVANPMMDALRAESARTYTQNGANAYDSTLSPTLDAFNNLTNYTYGSQVGAYLGAAWAENPDLTLRIIWNLRSIHDGKSENELFYRAFGWLYDNHPRTAITNLHLLVEPVCTTPKKKAGRAHGYWKDLLNILALATVDELSGVTQPPTFLHRVRPSYRYYRQRRNTGRSVEEVEQVRVTEKLAAKTARATAAVHNHARLEQKLQDPKYRALYITVARLFSERLLADIHLLHNSYSSDSPAARKELLREISLAPKWAPTPGASHDRVTNIATAIMRLLYYSKDAIPFFHFPSALATSSSLETAESTVILRSFYQRWVLTPLRGAMMIPETFMSANRWADIPYNRVSSICMKNNTDSFFKHDPEGFQKYLIAVEDGKNSISGATLLPHQLIAQVVAFSQVGEENDKYPELQKHKQALAAVQLRVVEAQWKTLVQNLRDAGTIDNAIAICDVSGSMGSLSERFKPKDVLPIFPSVALSLLLAQLAQPPFNDGFITFSASPQFVRLDPKLSLYETVSRMERAQWGMNTDLNAVFLRLILPLAVENRIAPQDMIKRLFIFSDMQFDEASYGAGDDWETNYDVIEKAFAAAGYEVPQVVYWNLAHHGTFEVLADRRGVAMMSGFSPSMLKVFMGEEVAPGEEDVSGGAVQAAKEEFTPLNVMKKVLNVESYAGLVVVD